jgi:hypothetical protein
MIVFAMVGIVFLFLTDNVLVFFNILSGYLGMTPSPVQGYDFYLILAVGYMYLVTLLAYLMYKHPENPFFPLLLAHGKLFSSILSLGLFIFHQPYLIYLSNSIVDGLIGIVALYFYQRVKMSA